MNLDNIYIKKIHNQGSNLNIMKYYQLRKLIEKLIKYDKNRDCFADIDFSYLIDKTIGYYNLYVAKKELSLVAGLLIGKPYPDKTIMSIAYVVANKYRNMGIGTELLGRAINTCFAEFECLSINLSASIDNIFSRKMIESFDFELISDDELKKRNGCLVKQAKYSLDYNQYIKKYDRFKQYPKLS
jgi:RimJ/RimL family protein N-acetyltransferase